MSKKVWSLIFLLSILFVQGGASRYNTRELPLSSIFNQYNRNFIVAKPTMIGNLICGVPTMIPLAYLTMGLTTPLVKTKLISDDVGFYVVNNGSMLPAFACGIVTGTLFIPFSYICPENPWYIGLKTGFRNSKCIDDIENQLWQLEKKEKADKKASNI